MSNSTQWSPVTQLERKSWLLANGEVVTEPDLEETPSGRKVRVKGTNMSAYSKDMADLLQKAVRAIAKERGTKVWMPLERAHFWNSIGDQIPRASGALNAITNQMEDTLVYWTFRHVDLPIEATLYVKIDARGHYYRQEWQASTKLAMPLSGLDEISPTIRAVAEDSLGWENLKNTAGLDWDQRSKLDTLSRDKSPSWDVAMLSTYSHSNQRMVIKYALEQVRKIEELETIQIPDLRDPDKPAWLTLELFNSNYKADFEQDCLDVLDGAPTVAEALEHYNAFRATLGKIGLVLDEREENHILEALAGKKEALTVGIGTVLNMDGIPDQEHAISIHLPTGTLYSRCGVRRVDKDAIAEKWEEAKMLASLTGSEDELLVYAREYVKREQETAMKKLVKQRTVKL